MRPSRAERRFDRQLRMLLLLETARQEAQRIADYGLHEVDRKWQRQMEDIVEAFKEHVGELPL
jgi:L-rhamnose mutarotase